MDSIPKEIVARFMHACHLVGAKGLAKCSSGNMSLRLDDDTMIITASRSWMERLTEDEVTLCRISDREVIAGKKPSVEIGFHSGILSSNTRANAVLHFQSPAATTVACIEKFDMDFNVTPEIPYYIGPIARVPFILPGSPELAAAVVHAAKDHNLIILTNHGLVVWAGSLDQAIQNAVYFELACEMLLKSGGRAAPMPKWGADELTSIGESGPV